MGARDNIHSDRSREDIDRDQEAQRKAAELRLAMLCNLEPAKFHAAMEEMFKIGLHQKINKRTRGGMLRDFTRRFLDLVQPTPGVTINQGALIDAAGLLRLVSSGDAGHTTTGSSALPSASDTIGVPNATPLSDPCPPEAVVTPGREPEDGPPARASSGTVPTPPCCSLDAPGATETLGDPFRCPRCHARTDDEPHACPVPEEGA